jgi:hypothetical protein
MNSLSSFPDRERLLIIVSARCNEIYFQLIYRHSEFGAGQTTPVKRRHMEETVFDEIWKSGKAQTYILGSIHTSYLSCFWPC